MGNGERGTGGSQPAGVPAFLTRLVERWAEQGIRPVGGVSEEELAAFEARRGVRIPADLRAYFRHVGGVLVNGETAALDHDLIRFWPLDEVSTLREAWVAAPDAERWFVIADYAMWTWAYVVRMGAEGATVAVSLGGAELRPVADSFEQFVELYLRRDPLVISPDQTTTHG